VLGGTRKTTRGDEQSDVASVRGIAWHASWRSVRGSLLELPIPRPLPLQRRARAAPPQIAPVVHELRLLSRAATEIGPWGASRV